VPQQIDLFAGNIIENIAIGDLSPNLEALLTICTQLGITKFVESLPNGFQTYIGENGTSLSGGQRQRIAIARALYRNPEILILDEATSALDSESENYVLSTIQQLRQQGKTIIIIAHRLSTVMAADKIVLLDNGQILEAGNHSDLYTKGTKYYDMWQKQFPFQVEMLQN
jgi:ATP-binding cassette subfamily B protein